MGEWYITILQGMRDELGLKGNELLVYAFLHGYSQKGQGCYYGSLAHLQEVCGIASRQTAIDILKSLLTKGLITRDETFRNGAKIVMYSVCPKIGQGVQKMDTGCPKNGHNNKDENISIDILSKKERTAKFQKPSLEEVREYCAERKNRIDPEVFVNFYESNGWKVGKASMKDWRAAVRTWEKRSEYEKASKPAPAKKEDPYTYNKRLLAETMARITGSTRKEDVDEQ